jgi:hypothetical protein
MAANMAANMAVQIFGDGAALHKSHCAEGRTKQARIATETDVYSL